MDSRPLEGQHVIVTGAGRGIGRAAAVELAGLGALVTLVSRTRAQLEETSAAVDATGGSARVEVADVTQPDQVDAVVDRAVAVRPLWGCVNSAGVNRTGATVDYPVADFDHVMTTNVRSTFLMCQAVGRALLAAGGGGRIVNVSSQMGSVGYPGRAAYCTSKHAVDGLTRALAVEWASTGVTVNAVAPTFVETELTQVALSDDAFRADVLSRIAAGRLATLDEIAVAISFLMSPRASMVTGDILRVDGGWTAW